MISGNPPGDGWPVLVWFHPGMFHSGFAAQWDVSAMGIKHKVCVYQYPSKNTESTDKKLYMLLVAATLSNANAILILQLAGSFFTGCP